MGEQYKLESMLEYTRNDKVKNLGFVCYNLYVDNALCIPEMSDTVKEIKRLMGYITDLKKNDSQETLLAMYEGKLEDKLNELGCLCYNLYVDDRLINSKIKEICGSISTINSELTEDNARIKENKPGKYGNDEIELYEEIPEGYKECECGYKNKDIARFCAKCGRVL